MTFKEIKELIIALKDSNLSEFSLKKADFEVKIKTDKYSGKVTVAPAIQAVPAAVTAPIAPVQAPPAPAAAGAPAAAVDSAEVASNTIEVKSPIVGTFYRSAGPDKAPFVKVGDSINIGSVVCIVEAMKLFNEIESEVSGTIVKILVDDASPVEYDQPLFLLEA